VVAVFDEIVWFLRTCGPLDVVPTKTSINLLSRTSLGGIRLQRRKARLGIVLMHHVRDPRVQSTLRLSPRRIVHFLDLATVGDVDAVVRRWLREAHAVGMLAGHRPRSRRLTTSRSNRSAPRRC
jgi:hypothetical protein